ncbi:hypothetical protein NR798_28640 [Archangium gephyra]|uniref:hypothetical protein n=1 Tax=Archangium gephyra TaxID=48 RepID=UPI0035D45E54
MFRIDGDGYAVVDGKNRFTGGDPLIPIPPTMMTADWANAVQEEIAGVVEQGGLTLSKADNGQLWAALVARFGRLGSANTWTDTQSIGGALSVAGTSTLTGKVTANGGLVVNETSGVASISGVGASHAASGTAQPTKYVFGFATLPTTSGANYPLTGLAKVFAGNSLGFDTRVWTTGTADTWTRVDLGLSYDVDNIMGAGGWMRWGSNGFKVASAQAATAAAPATAPFALTNCNLSLDGVPAPSSTVAVKNLVTPTSIAKAWVSVQFSNNTGGFTVRDGLNIASVVRSGNTLVVTFAAPFASANVALFPQYNAVGDGNERRAVALMTSTTTAVVRLQGEGGAAVNLTDGTSAVVSSVLDLLAFGAQ